MRTATKPIVQRSGFTLIELMVVMLLISIVLAVTIPRFEGGIIEDPTNKMTRWMINTVRTVRSQAIQKQKIQSLVVDLNDHRMWITSEDMGEEAVSAAAETAYKLPADLQFVDVQFPKTERITSGTAEINFYPAGYSDHALIRLENEEAKRYSYLLQPLLPKVKFYEEWLDF